VDLVNPLVAEIAVAGVPAPVPVVMKAIAGEGPGRRRPGPEVVIDAARHGFDRRTSDGVSPLEAQAARDIDVAEGAAVQVPARLDHAASRPALRAMLHDPSVLLGGTHELLAFPQVVRARLLDVHVLPGLTRPDRDQRMPVIGRGDRN